MPEIVVYQLPEMIAQPGIIGYGKGYGQKRYKGHCREETECDGLLSDILMAEIPGGKYDYSDISDDLGLCTAKVGDVDGPDSVAEKLF